MMRAQIDRDMESYNEKEENIRNVRRDAGRLGGLAKASKSSKTKQTVANVAKDKDKDKDKDKEETSPDGDVKKDPAVAAVMSAYMDRINPNVSEQLVAEMLGFLRVMGQECCLRAIQIAQDERKTQWSYVRGILRAKQAQGVRCLADWDKIDDERERRKQDGGHSGSVGDQNTGTRLPGITYL